MADTALSELAKTKAWTERIVLPIGFPMEISQAVWMYYINVITLLAVIQHTCLSELQKTMWTT